MANSRCIKYLAGIGDCLIFLSRSNTWFCFHRINGRIICTSHPSVMGEQHLEVREMQGETQLTGMLLLTSPSVKPVFLVYQTLNLQSSRNSITLTYEKYFFPLCLPNGMEFYRRFFPRTVWWLGIKMHIYISNYQIFWWIAKHIISTWNF